MHKNLVPKLLMLLLLTVLHKSCIYEFKPSVVRSSTAILESLYHIYYTKNTSDNKDDNFLTNGCERALELYEDVNKTVLDDTF